jgi:hypothetical protein
MKQMELLAHMEDMRNRFLGMKLEGRMLLGKPRYRYNI